MKTKLTTMLLALAGGITFFANQMFAADSAANSVNQTNEPSPFQIIVTPRKTRVHVGDPFKVSLEVKNISNINQQFKVWSCSWDMNWRSSNTAIGWVGWACRQNGPMKVNLAPGESFKETLDGKEMEMRVLQAVSTNKISFQMVLHTGASMHIYKSGETMPDDEKGEIYYSNEVTVDVISN